MEKSKMKSEKETNSRENKQKAGYSQHASPYNCNLHSAKDREGYSNHTVGMPLGEILICYILYAKLS